MTVLEVTQHRCSYMLGHGSRNPCESCFHVVLLHLPVTFPFNWFWLWTAVIFIKDYSLFVVILCASFLPVFLSFPLAISPLLFQAKVNKTPKRNAATTPPAWRRRPSCRRRSRRCFQDSNPVPISVLLLWPSPRLLQPASTTSLSQLQAPVGRARQTMITSLYRC